MSRERGASALAILQSQKDEHYRYKSQLKFATKPQIALSQIEAALKAGVARGVVLADAGYGADGAFRARLTALGLTYAVGVQPTRCLAARRDAAAGSDAVEAIPSWLREADPTRGHRRPMVP